MAREEGPSERWVKIILPPLVTLGIAVGITRELTHGGQAIQKSIATANVARDYVKIAISILESKDADQRLKAYAGALFKKFSPVPIPPDLRGPLTSGRLTFPIPKERFHGASLTLECVGPSGDPSTPVRRGETVTCTIPFTNPSPWPQRLDSIKDTVHRPSGALSSDNLLLAPVTLAPRQGIIVTYEYQVLAEDTQAGSINDTAAVAGVELPTGGPFSLTLPTRLNVEPPGAAH